MTAITELQADLIAHGFTVELKLEDFVMKDEKHYWILEVSRGGKTGGLYLSHDATGINLQSLVSGCESRYPE